MATDHRRRGLLAGDSRRTAVGFSSSALLSEYGTRLLAHATSVVLLWMEVCWRRDGGTDISATARRATGVGGWCRLVRVSCAAALALALVFVAFPTGAMAAWPIYGHDLANSRDAGVDGPSAAQVGSLSKAWTFTSSTGDFTGTPVVANGILVAGNNAGWVYGLDAVTGTL